MSSAVIHSAGGNNSGFVGWSRASGYAISFAGCVFNGKLLQIDGNGNSNGGFIGWTGSNKTVTITNSLVAPAALADGETMADGNSATFARGWNETTTATNSYYTTAFGTAQGTGPFIYNALPNGIGTEGTTYGVSGITAYQNGIGCGGKYYTAPLATHTLTANLADGNYWTTFYCGDADYQITTDDAYAYTATVGSSEVTLTKQGTDIPKGAAVIIVSGGNGSDASVSISLSKTSGIAAYGGTNDLEGIDVRTPVASLGTGTFYVMGKTVAEGFGFFEYTAQYMPARKAYFTVPASSEARKFTMVFGDETGITDPTPDPSLAWEGSDCAWYTLDGRRLAQKPTTKGVYVSNGRKVAIK